MTLGRRDAGGGGDAAGADDRLMLGAGLLEIGEAQPPAGEDYAHEGEYPQDNVDPSWKRQLWSDPRMVLLEARQPLRQFHLFEPERRLPA